MKRIVAFALFVNLFVFPLLANSENALSINFDFGAGQQENGYLKVEESTNFNFARGYGFDFNTTVKNAASLGGVGVASDYCCSDKPFYFSVMVPEGNYKVTLTVGNDQKETNATIKAEARRVMVFNHKIKKGVFEEISFNVNVRTPMLPDGHAVKLKKAELNGHPSWDNKLTLEFNGVNPAVSAITIERLGDVKTVYICGDSTVTDERNEPWSGWGMIFPLFFNDQISVANYAMSGLTLKVFKGQQRLEKIISLIQPGDYMMIQFAHNDMKKGGAHADANTEYRELIMEFAQAAIEKGAHPIFVTSMHRRAFDENGQIINTLEEYPSSMIITGQENHIPVIDLNAMSEVLYETLGVEGSKKAFVHYPAGTFPNQEEDLEDNTHFNGYGAMQLAKCVIEGLKKSDVDLVKYIKTDLNNFSPAKPDNFKENFVPLSPTFNMEKPDGN